MKIVPEISLRHDLQYFLFISTPTIDIEPNKIRLALTIVGFIDICANACTASYDLL